jgi:hypothetical protein
MHWCFIFKNAPLENQDDLRIMFGPIAPMRQALFLELRLLGHLLTVNGTTYSLSVKIALQT